MEKYEQNQQPHLFSQEQPQPRSKSVGINVETKNLLKLQKMKKRFASLKFLLPAVRLVLPCLEEILH